MRGSPAVVSRLGVAFGYSLVLGALLAGLALPLVGGIGLTAKAQSDNFLARPASLQFGALGSSSRVLAADGSVLALFFSANRLNATYDEIPELTRKALIAIEDSRFYAHNGIYLRGSLRAAVRNGTSLGVQQGGSTLTQQLVKNLLLEQARDDSKARAAARAQNLDRKLAEARYALSLEKRLTKDEILVAYLNIAYYGNGVYGVKTAADHYFAKPVQNLSLAEGALLAGMVQNPNNLDPGNPATRSAALARRGTVLDRMRDLGLITPAHAAAARKEPLRLKLQKVRSGCEAPGVSAPFFCDFVRRQLEADTPLGQLLGSTREERQQRLLTGGLTIRTTLDPVVQRAAQQAVDAQVPPTDPSGTAAVADTVEPATGAVRAMAVNRQFGSAPGQPDQTKVNLATGGNLGFQGGSTFKIFVLAEALRLGLPLTTSLYAPATYTSPLFKDNGQPYTMSNSEPSEAGTFDLTTATTASVNTFFVQLEERVGTAGPAALAEALGVRNLAGAAQPGGDGALNRGGSFTLGGDTVSPLALAGAYAAFANHGTFCPPRAITGITDEAGTALAVPQPPCTPVIEPVVADTVTAVLAQVIDGTDRHRTGAGASLGRPAAGKTGTADESRATWFVGYVPQLATAVWVGRPTPTPLQRVRINGVYYGSVFGGSLAAPIWRQAMTGALREVPSEAFARPSPSPSASPSASPSPGPAGVPSPGLTSPPPSPGLTATPTPGPRTASPGPVPSRIPTRTAAPIPSPEPALSPALRQP